MGWPGESATGAFAQSDQYNSARMTNRRLAILGAGNMGRALIGGLLRSGTRPEHLSVGEPVAGAREALARDLGITAGADNAAAVRGAAVVVLAGKPQDAAPLLTALAGAGGGPGPILLPLAPPPARPPPQ